MMPDLWSTQARVVYAALLALLVVAVFGHPGSRSAGAASPAKFTFSEFDGRNATDEQIQFDASNYLKSTYPSGSSIENLVTDLMSSRATCSAFHQAVGILYICQYQAKPEYTANSTLYLISLLRPATWNWSIFVHSDDTGKLIKSIAVARNGVGPN